MTARDEVAIDDLIDLARDRDQLGAGQNTTIGNGVKALGGGTTALPRSSSAKRTQAQRPREAQDVDQIECEPLTLSDIANRYGFQLRLNYRRSLTTTSPQLKSHLESTE